MKINNLLSENSGIIFVLLTLIIILSFLDMSQIHPSLTGFFLKEGEWEHKIEVKAISQEEEISYNILFDKYKSERCEDGILIVSSKGQRVNFDVVNATYENGLCTEATVKFKNIIYKPPPTTSTILLTNTSLMLNITNETIVNEINVSENTTINQTQTENKSKNITFIENITNETQANSSQEVMGNAITGEITVAEKSESQIIYYIYYGKIPEEEYLTEERIKSWKDELNKNKITPQIIKKNGKLSAKLKLKMIEIEFRNFEKNKANWNKTPFLTKSANIKNFVSSGGFILKDFIWVDSNGFLNEWDYDASIILPSTYSKVFYCTGSKENPDCFFIQKCSYLSKPCYEEVNGKTIVFSEHFSGGGGGDSLHKYDYTTGVGTDRWAFHTNSSAGNDLPPANPWARDLEFPTSDYDAINSSDDSRATTSGGSSTINPAQIFEIQVSENRSTITQLDFYWEGYGDAGSPSFYVWNWTTSSWENLGSHSQTTSDGIITATRSSGIEGYVNASGYIELTSVDTANKPNFIKTDYIYINVTFQVTNSPPKWSNNQSSVPTVYNSNFVSLFNVTWADDSDSNGYNFSWFESNFTGSPNNYTAFRFTGTNISSWNGTLPAGTFYWKFHANDSNGKWNSTDKWTFTIGKAPTETRLYLNGTEDNKTYNKNDVANFTIVTNASGRDVELWTDYPDRIYKFWNSDVEPLKNLTTLSITGLFKWVGIFSGDQNFSFSLKTWYTNITGSDTTSPNWFDNSTNSTASSMPVEHRIKWTDNTGLEGYIFSFDNCTGALENITEGTLSGTEDWSNVTVVTNSTGGCTIRWKVFANDSSGNWRETDVFSYQTSALTTEILFPTQQFATNTTSGKFLILDVDVSNSIGDIESGVNFNVNLSNSTISTTATINSQSYNSTKGNWEVNITTPSLTDDKWYNLWVNATYQSFYDEDEELTAIYYGQDIIPPITRNQGENSTAIGEGGSITLFAQGRDAMGLDWALLATNETGEWENKTKNQIIYDGFESGNFEAGGWTADPSSGVGSWQVTDSGTYSTNSGQYSATSAITGTYGSGNYTLWEANDTTGFQDIQVQYAFSYSTFACGVPSTVYDNFDFYVEYSTDGGTNWILLDSDSCGLSSIPWETRGPFTLPKSAENNPNFRIRFIAHISGANACSGNRVQIDDVNITGNGGRIVFSGEKTWEWYNFTWYNFSIPAPKTIAWKIWYSDISGNKNSTDIMTFYIEQSPKVDKPVTFNNQTLQEKTVFIRNSEITIRVNVTDPDGRDDIDKVWIKILNTTDNVKLDNTLMTNISTITNGYTYEYNYTIPSDADYGLWSLYTYSNDSANVVKFNSTTFQVKYKEAPIQSNWLPANGSNRFVSEFNVTLNLDENGDCKWSTVEYDYDQMTNDCTGDNTQIITCPLSGLFEGSNDIYIACNDTEGNYDNSSENTHLLYNVNTTWFNTSFNYRREILINSTTNEEDYQVKIVFNDSNINYSHTTGNDLRFFNYTGNELNYWIEKWNESGDSVVWVRVPELNYTYNKTTYIIVYYNNSIVQTKSNGTLSFPYFDDWKENNIDDWKYNGATDSYLNNHHQWTENTTNFTKYREIILLGNFLNWWSGNYDHSNIGWCANKTYFRGGEDYVSIYFEHRVNNGANDTHIFVKLEIGKDGNEYTTYLKSFPKPSTTDNISIYLKYYSDYIGYEVRNADTGELIISDYIDNSSKIPDSSNVPYLFQHTWDYTPNMGGPSFDWVSPTYVDIYNYGFNGGMQLRIDYWFIKKYTYPEPTTITGSEQFQSLNNPPVLSNKVTSPSNIYTNIDTNLNVTCYDVDVGDILTAYWKVYLNTGSGYIKDEEGYYPSLSNDTNTLIYTYNSGNYSKNDKIIFEVWCSDGKENTTKENTTEITVLNTPPNPDSNWDPTTTHDPSQDFTWIEGSDDDGDNVMSYLCIDDDSSGRDNDICDIYSGNDLDSPVTDVSLTYDGEYKTYYGRLIATDIEDNSTNYDFEFNLTNEQPSAPSGASLDGQTTGDSTPTITFTKGTDSDTDPVDTVTQYISVDSSSYTDSGDTYTTSGDISQFTITPDLADGTYYVRQWADDNTEASNSHSSNYEYTFTVNTKIIIESIQIQPDEGDPGILINPIANSNKTVNVTVTVDNSTTIDKCVISIFNSSMSYSNPVFYFTDGIIQNCGPTCECFKEWDMEYWRNDGNWNVSVDINVTNGISNFTSQNFTYNSLSSIDVNISTITFSGIPNQTVNSTDAYPLQIKNTGNQIVNVSINGSDFQGVSDSNYVVVVSNSTYNQTETGEFEQLTHVYKLVFTDIHSAVSKLLYFRAYLPIGFLQQDYQNTIEFRVS